MRFGRNTRVIFIQDRWGVLGLLRLIWRVMYGGLDLKELVGKKFSERGLAFFQWCGHVTCLCLTLWWRIQALWRGVERVKGLVGPGETARMSRRLEKWKDGGGKGWFLLKSRDPHSYLWGVRFDFFAVERVNKKVGRKEKKKNIKNNKTISKRYVHKTGSICRKVGSSMGANEEPSKKGRMKRKSIF